jgi:hypothetical protein
MALTNPYCTLVEVQKETGNSDTDLVDWFETCINNASRWIEEHCYRDFLYHDYSTTAFTVPEKDGVGTELYLNWPIITLDSVQAKEVLVPEDLYTFNVGDRYITRRDKSDWIGKPSGMRKTNYHSPMIVSRAGFDLPIQVKGTFGFVNPPAAVRIACYQIASAWTNEKRREKVGMDGARTSLLDANIPTEALELLKRWKFLVN